MVATSNFLFAKMSKMAAAENKIRPSESDNDLIVTNAQNPIVAMIKLIT
jgi:hypothetical protein